MKIPRLILLISLFALILTGCEKELISPVDLTIPSQSTTEFAQEVLSNLSNTAAERAFVDLAEASKGVAETLAVDDGTSVEPLFSKIAELASAVTILEHAFVEAKCDIELRDFAHASIEAVKAYTIRDAADMERSLQKLADEVKSAEAALQHMPAGNDFIPFAFGYGSFIDNPECWCTALDLGYPDYEFGEIIVVYDLAIRSVSETNASVIEFLTNEGYTDARIHNQSVTYAVLDFGAYIDPLLIMDELSTIPGIARLTHPVSERDEWYPFDDLPPAPNVQIIDRVRTRYNVDWCHGNFEALGNILIEESGFDFFDYYFVRNLADIYAEEIPEASERIQMNLFYLRLIAIEFLELYLRDSEKRPEEMIEIYRQSVISGNVDIDHDIIGEHYYLTTDYWKQLVTDHLNQ